MALKLQPACRCHNECRCRGRSYAPAALTADGVGRAVARANRAAGAKSGWMSILDQGLADFRRAAFLINMGFVFLAEEAQGADDRGGRALTQTTQRR